MPNINNTAPANTAGISVLNLPVAGDAVAANGFVTITGLKPFPFRDLIGYSRTIFALGTLQRTEIDFTTVGAPVIGDAYKIVIKPNVIQLGVAVNPEQQPHTYIVIASTAVLTDLINAFVTSINNDIEGYVTASLQAGDVLRLDQNDFTIDGFAVPVSPPGTAFTVITIAFVAPQGSVAQVNQIAPYATTAPGAQYSRFDLIVDQRNTVTSNGATQFSRARFIVYADELAGGFAAFLANLDVIVDGSGTNAQYDAVV